MLNNSLQTIFVFQAKPNAGKSKICLELQKIFKELGKKVIYLSSDYLRIPQHNKRLPDYNYIPTVKELSEAGAFFDGKDLNSFGCKEGLGGHFLNDDGTDMEYPVKDAWGPSMRRTLDYIIKTINDEANKDAIILIDGQFSIDKIDCVNFLIYLNNLQFEKNVDVNFFYIDINT